MTSLSPIQSSLLFVGVADVDPISWGAMGIEFAKRTAMSRTGPTELAMC